MIALCWCRVACRHISYYDRDSRFRVTSTVYLSGVRSHISCALCLWLCHGLCPARRPPARAASARAETRETRGEPREARRTRPSRRWPLQADPRTAHLHRAATLRATIHIAAYALCTLCTKFRVFTSRRAPALRSRARAAMPRARRRYRTRWVFPCRDPSFRRARCATQPAWPRQCS